MSPLQHHVYVSVWALVLLCETSLLLVLFWRRAWRSNAAFVSFIAFCVLRSCVLFYSGFTLKGSTAYSLIRWGAYVPQSVLLIAVVLEVIQIVFRPFEALPRGARSNFVLAIFTFIFLTALFTFELPGGRFSEWITFLRAVDQGVSWSLLGIFAIISVFAKLVGIPWNHRVYGIVLGFLFYLSIDVVVVTMTAQRGFPVQNYISLVNMLAFLITCSEWTYYFAHEEVPRTVPKMDEVIRIAEILSQYVFVIESLEVTGSRQETSYTRPANLVVRNDER
jgi:hypothetical protein